MMAINKIRRVIPGSVKYFLKGKTGGKKDGGIII
jgi:hypothetical protein